MPYLVVCYLVKLLSVLAVGAIIIKYWGDIYVVYWDYWIPILAALLSPYLSIYFIATPKNYRNFKLTVLRLVTAIAVFGIGISFYGIKDELQEVFVIVLWQLTFISAAEAFNLFCVKNDDLKKI